MTTAPAWKIRLDEACKTAAFVGNCRFYMHPDTAILLKKKSLDEEQPTLWVENWWLTGAFGTPVVEDVDVPVGVWELRQRCYDYEQGGFGMVHERLVASGGLD